MFRQASKNKRTIANGNNDDHNPLLSTIVITDARSPSSSAPLFCAMSDDNGGHDGDTDCFHVADSDDDNVSGSTDVSLFDLLEPLTTIWDCLQMNLATRDVRSW
jgi:hypothetical protein